jgi:D-alanyl-D-alanine carboxypeptidase/D-alanyl-D-alanine-endopeptidase (penicillin-binding protein 4)
VLVEALDGGPVMSHNPDLPLNPASVLKLATSLAALERFGPWHRFETAFVPLGKTRDGALEGALGIRCDGDPTLGRSVVGEVARALGARGIRRVGGELLVAGPLTFVTTDETADAAARFRAALVEAGIEIAGPTRLVAEVPGDPIFVIRSEPLVDIVQRLNAHSNNRLADNLGAAVGGGRGVAQFLHERLGVREGSMAITHPSGLHDNQLTARATMRVLRGLIAFADRHRLPLDKLMPLNGVDSGTMRVRLLHGGMAGAVAAKTGTQSNVDGGVSSLAGVLYTREFGPLLFVVLNTHGSVYYYRDWQDALVEDMAVAVGGPARVGRAVDTVPVGLEVHEFLTHETVTLVGVGQQGDPSDLSEDATGGD